jgi:hypothetical protein
MFNLYSLKYHFFIKNNIMTLFINSEVFFYNFLNRYDIVLDDNYNKIKELYYSNKLDNNIKSEIKTDYNIYFKLFNNYKNLNSEINFIYYIIILYYLNHDKLLNYIRFLNCKLCNFDLIKKDKIISFSELRYYKKNELIKYLKMLIDYHSDILLFFIISIQNYL